MALTTNRSETERKFSKLLIKKNKILSTMLEERQHYLSILSTENITKSLSYQEAIKE